MRFTRAHRIRKSREFLHLRESGTWVPGRYLHLRVAQRPVDGADSRLGMAVSRKVGNAVNRNRVKRRLRALFQRMRAELAVALDVVVIARRGAAEASFADLERDLRRGLRPWLSGPA